MSQAEKQPKSVTTLFLNSFYPIWSIFGLKSVMKWCFYESLIRLSTLLWRPNPIIGTLSAVARTAEFGCAIFLGKTVTKFGAVTRNRPRYWTWRPAPASAWSPHVKVQSTHTHDHLTARPTGVTSCIFAYWPDHSLDPLPYPPPQHSAAPPHTLIFHSFWETAQVCGWVL